MYRKLEKRLNKIKKKLLLFFLQNKFNMYLIYNEIIKSYDLNNISVFINGIAFSLYYVSDFGVKAI